MTDLKAKREKEIFEIRKLQYKIDKASKLFEFTKYKIEVNGNFFTLKEYMQSTIDLLKIKIKELKEKSK